MEKKIKTAKLTLVIIMVIYFAISILAIISQFNVHTNDDSIGQLTIYSFARISWWPFMIIVLMLLSYILYSKKYLYGAILETLTGGILLANVIRNMISYGTNALSMLLSFILPAIFIYQGVIIISKRKKDDGTSVDKKAIIKTKKVKTKKPELKIKSRKAKR